MPLHARGRQLRMLLRLRTHAPRHALSSLFLILRSETYIRRRLPVAVDAQPLQRAWQLRAWEFEPWFDVLT